MHDRILRMNPPKIVLGINTSHGDSAAAIIVDGQLVAAAEEERFTRVKHYALFPNQAIEFCLKAAAIKPQQVEALAIAGKPTNAAFQKFALAVRHPGLVKHQIWKKPAQSKTNFNDDLKRLGLDEVPRVSVEHHLAHMMSSRYLGGNKPTALLSFDGLGDFVSAAMGFASGTEIEIAERVYFPHSLGFFYSAMTQYLGFPYFGDEFKMMGLSSYGQPEFLENMRALVKEKDGFGFSINLKAFPVSKLATSFSIQNAQPRIQPLFDRDYLENILKLPPRKPSGRITTQHFNLAASVQRRFEEVANHLVANVFQTYNETTLALSGGCAHNSLWIGKIPRHTAIRKVLVAPASHDAGTALGAAIYTAKVPVSPAKRNWALLGPEITDTHCPTPSHLYETNFKDTLSLIQWLVKELDRGKIIGLFQGRMEFGPRALGQRSILCDPRRSQMRDLINSRIKHRESFRPFAAAILKEHQEQWFQHSFDSPYMEAVFKVNPLQGEKIPAVVHVDNTCRIQSVEKHLQPFFWNLLEAFRKETGVPLLLNTSFNDQQPIVCSQTDALLCFEKCRMDHLVLGSKVISSKKPQLIPDADRPTVRLDSDTSI